MKPFHPYPKATDRAPYEALPKEVTVQIMEQGEACLGFAYPYLKATDYLAYCRTGNRVDFEDLYFAKRRALNSLVLAECVEYKGRFLDDIINGIYAICDEPGWQLPAHNAYIRGQSALPLPDVTAPVLDLFSCETGALLACVYYLLKETLDQVTPMIGKRIIDELDRRIRKPYFTRHFWWMGKGSEPMCNWTIWCTQNVLLTFFLAEWKEEWREKVIAKSIKSMHYFLKDYGQDGCCEEGAQYYRHAGLCLFNALEVLNIVTDGGMQSFYEDEKIRNIALYIYNVHVDDKYYFNFADCSPVAGRAGVREYLFGKRTAQPQLAQFGATDFVAGGSRVSREEINLFYRLQELFTYEEICREGKKVQAKQDRPDVFYPSVGLFLSHGERFSLAVKAGDNDDSHNHNDVGSFTLYVDGQPLFVDIGVESYTAKTFSDKRYEIWTMQSGYHNLPTICGQDEKDGAKYRAEQAKAWQDGRSSFFTARIDKAYPLVDTCSYVRTLSLHRENETVELVDDTDAGDVILNFITYARPALEEGRICLEGQPVEVAYEGANPLVVETLPITDARLQTAWDHDLYRIRLRLNDHRFRMNIKVK